MKKNLQTLFNGSFKLALSFVLIATITIMPIGQVLTGVFASEPSNEEVTYKIEQVINEETGAVTVLFTANEGKENVTIESITLPNGEIIKGSYAEYVAEENDSYQFVINYTVAEIAEAIAPALPEIEIVTPENIEIVTPETEIVTPETEIVTPEITEIVTPEEQPESILTSLLPVAHADELTVDVDKVKIVNINVTGVIAAAPITHTVTFNVNGKATAVQVPDGNKVSKPTDPTLNSGRFIGWSTDSKSFKEAYDFSTPITEAITIYAILGEMDGETPTIVYQYGDKNVPLGYFFGAPYCSPSEQNLIFKIELNNYIAQESDSSGGVNSFYYISGGDAGTAGTINYRKMINNNMELLETTGKVYVTKRNGYIGYSDQTLTQGTKTGTLQNTPSKNEYDLNNTGTYSFVSESPEIATIDGNGVVTFLKAGTANIVVKRTGDANHAAATKIVAITSTEAAPITHTVTFNVNGKATAVQVLHGSTAVKSNVPAVSGKIFRCWSLDNEYDAEEYSFDTPITEAITLYAIYKNDPGVINGILNITEYAYGETVKLSFELYSLNFSVTSYTSANQNMKLTNYSYISGGNAGETSRITVKFEQGNPDYIFDYQYGVGAGTITVVRRAGYIGYSDQTLTQGTKTGTLQNTPSKNEYDLDNTGTYSFVSNSPEIATVDGNGVVTFLKAGTANIVVKRSGDANHKGATKIVAVTSTVAAPIIDGTTTEGGNGTTTGGGIENPTGGGNGTTTGGGIENPTSGGIGTTTGGGIENPTGGGIGTTTGGGIENPTGGGNGGSGSGNTGSGSGNTGKVSGTTTLKTNSGNTGKVSGTTTLKTNSGNTGKVSGTTTLKANSGNTGKVSGTTTLKANSGNTGKVSGTTTLKTNSGNKGEALADGTRAGSSDQLSNPEYGRKSFDIILDNMMNFWLILLAALAIGIMLYIKRRRDGKVN